MPTVKTPSISSQKKIVSSSSPMQQRPIFKSDEIIKDSDDEGKVLPPRNGKQKSESKGEPKDPSIKSMRAKTSPAISHGAPKRKRKRNTPSAASDSPSDSQINKEIAENVSHSKREVRRESTSNGRNGRSARKEISSGRESGSGNEDGVESSDNEFSKINEIITKKAKKSRRAAESASRYRPPSGFDPATINVTSHSSLAELFSSARLRNKQIWHVAVPSSVRIDSLREFSTARVQTGDTVLSYKGADFGLVLQPKTRNAKKALLLPSGETNEYRPVEVEIARTLHLQQLPRKGPNGLSATLKAATENRSRYEKAPPQQPDGLRMHYHPFGVTEHSSDESQPEEQTHVPKFRRPLGVETSPPTQMQNGESIDVEMYDAQEKPRSKHKQKRDNVNVEIHNASLESARPNQNNTKRDSIGRATPSTKHKRTSDTNNVEMTQGSPQPLPPSSIPDKRNRGNVEVGMYNESSKLQSTQKLKRKKKRQANSEPDIEALATIDSSHSTGLDRQHHIRSTQLSQGIQNTTLEKIDIESNGTERRRKKHRHTRSESYQPAGEQKKYHASTTKEDRDLHTVTSGIIDLANSGSGEKKHKTNRHAESDASPAAKSSEEVNPQQ